MKKLLPISRIFLVFIVLFFLSLPRVYADTPTPVPTVTLAPTSALPIPTPTPVVPVAGAAVSSGDTCAVGTWCEDPNVTFTGKLATRANDFLNFSLFNYNWAFVAPGQTNPLEGFWFTIVTQVVTPFFLLAILIGAFILVMTRGRNLTIKQFIPRFILVAIFVVLSYAVLRLSYQLADIIQGFFLNARGKLIDATDLLNISFDYKTFTGLRMGGQAFDESAFISLLLIKLTTVTYFVMSGILLVRKIILWFFIALSPIFPLLLLYNPVRNTAKIWFGEFLRWLLYAPLFAILLSGLVAMWASPVVGIPLNFNDFKEAKAGTVIYPSAINILIGGPGQIVSLTNNVNTPDTFAQYMVALLMLWAVIILPFVLLQIFLNYVNNYNFAENKMVQQVLNSTLLRNRPAPAPVTPSTSPPPATTGLARALPFANKTYVTEAATATTGLARAIPTQTTNQTFNNISNRFSTPVSQMNMSSMPNNAEVLRLANLFVPTLRDIARYETSTHTSDIRSHQEVTQFKETLERIANPSTITSSTEKERFSSLREQLVQEKEKGNPIATAVLSASNITNTNTNTHQVSAGAQPGQPIAGQVGQEQKKIVDTNAAFPVVNRVQAVNLDDYEAVKKMWTENYQKLDPPKEHGIVKDRKAWVKEDIANINNVISLLTSTDQKAKKEGMDKVANILPFLLIGGFSQTEVIAYLKSKLEAAKSVDADLSAKDEEEATTLDAEHKKTEEEKTMHMTAEEQTSPQEQPTAPTDEKNNNTV